jgi:hypothetical protein
MVSYKNHVAHIADVVALAALAARAVAPAGVHATR